MKVIIRKTRTKDSHKFVRIFVGRTEMNDRNRISSASSTRDGANRDGHAGDRAWQAQLHARGTPEDGT